MKNNHVTRLEIDLNAVENNLRCLKSRLKESTRVMAVVKAFAYGSSAAGMATFLQDKVDYFAVAYTPEGMALRAAGIEQPIMVLHPHNPSFIDIIDQRLEPVIYSEYLLKSFSETIEKKGLSNYPVHLKFNTGLNRLGFQDTAIPHIDAYLKDKDTLDIRSVFSHLAASEDPDERAFSLKQIDCFKHCAEALSTQLSTAPFRHMLNTSGVINYAEEAQFDMVRLGIGLYGFDNMGCQTKCLQNVLTLKSIISQIHTVEPGETIGYNRAFRTEKKRRIATIPVGHADGLSRRLSNGKGYVYINGQQAPIVGNVCMDMVMADVSHIDCAENGEVKVYRDRDHLNDLAQRIDTIPYEIIAAISQRIPRVLINERG